MATTRFTGSAASVKKVVTYTFGGTWESTDIIRVAFGNKSYDFVSGTTVIADILSALVTAWKALDKTLYKEFFEVTPSANSTTLTLTSTTAGEDFTCTITPLETGGTSADSQTIEGAGTATTGTVATANSGPYNWDIAGNWSGGAVPSTGDTVYLDKAGTWVKYGLSQSGVTLTKFVVSSNSKVGLPEVNASGYQEYRSKKLAIGATTFICESSGTVRVNFGSVQTTSTMTGAGTCQLVGTHASNALYVDSGIVGVADVAAETATFATIKMDGGTLTCGTGATLTTVQVDGGAVETNSAITTLNQNGGIVTHWAGAISQLNQYGGTVNYNSTTALGGNAVCYGVLNFDGTNTSKSVTNPVLVYGNGVVNDTAICVSSLVIKDYTTNGGRQHKLGTNVQITRVIAS